MSSFESFLENPKERASEVAAKLQRLRSAMAASRVDAVRLRGVDWFFWATGGGANWVILTSETGVAELLITHSSAWVLTSQIEDPRLSEEEVPPGLEVAVFPWADDREREDFVLAQVAASSGAAAAGAGPVVASDRPRLSASRVNVSRDHAPTTASVAHSFAAGQYDEQALPLAVLEVKRTLDAHDVLRYRTVGRLAAQAMSVAMMAARPEMTEIELAARGASELMKRGLEPTLILASGAERSTRHRHPLPKNQPIGDFAMMVFCARGAGLYANFTRFVYFRSLDRQEQTKFETLRRIEEVAFRATEAYGALAAEAGSAVTALSSVAPNGGVHSRGSLADVYDQLSLAYADCGHTGQIAMHHQGGSTGYLSRETIATPQTVLERILAPMAFAWNPSLPGAKVEDTVLLAPTGISAQGAARIEVLTDDPAHSRLSVYRP